MAYDQILYERLQIALEKRGVSFEEKRMMGGVAFMVDDKMCIGVHQNHIMARVGPEIFEEAIEKPGAKAMDFTGRPMNGWVMVEESGYQTDAKLDYWVDLCLAFNPLAKRSKKKNKK